MIFEKSKRKAEIENIHKLIRLLLGAARRKNKAHIFELYENAKKLDFDVIDEKTVDRYNKAVDKCNEVLGI